MSLTNPFFDIFVIFQIFSSFLNNYPANSEIKCLTEKKSVIRFLSAPMTMPCLLKKKCPKKFSRFLDSDFFFAKTNLLIPKLVVH